MFVSSQIVVRHVLLRLPWIYISESIPVKGRVLVIFQAVPEDFLIGPA